MTTLASTSTGSSAIPSKRKREDNKIHRNEKLYYPDGDIVLLSLPVEGIISAFKLDAVFLRRASPVFDGMLGLSSMEDAEKYAETNIITWNSSFWRFMIKR
ncbi:hypothetical protein M422DRAFT_241774 [Sphaerobolus stellatus SS14]|nr:hypothetical protein M422DRAFT_241774 [Sphaerobolus stellatus SS14]